MLLKLVTHPESGTEKISVYTFFIPIQPIHIKMYVMSLVGRLPCGKQIRIYKIDEAVSPYGSHF